MLPSTREDIPLTASSLHASGSSAGAVVVEARGVGKSFSGVTVLKDVDFDLRAGEVHALIGENGAGKSTLMKILAGVHVDYEGTVRVGGKASRFSGVQDAERAGVAIIHQELDLVSQLTVADNIFLGREPLLGGVFIDRRRIVRAAQTLLRRLGIDIDPDSRVGELRVGEQQLVEIAKALSLDARILIMDEPTSALSSSECETLFKVVRQLASSGVAIIYISHRLDEILALADRVTVLRDGRRVVTAPIGELSLGHMISAMVGHEMAERHRPEAVDARGGGPIGARLDARRDGLSRMATRPVWRQFRPAARGDPRHRRFARFWPHRDPRIDLRRQPRLARRADFGRRCGSRDRFSGRRLSDRHRAGDRGSQDARVASRLVDLRQRGAPLGRLDVTFQPARLCARGGARRRRRRATLGSLRGHRSDRLDAVGRQSAEGRHRQMAGDKAAHPVARRTDARHRRRRQGGDLRSHFQARGRWTCASSGELGNAGAAVAFRSGSGHVRRTADRHCCVARTRHRKRSCASRRPARRDALRELQA